MFVQTWIEAILNGTFYLYWVGLTAILPGAVQTQCEIGCFEPVFPYTHSKNAVQTQPRLPKKDQNWITKVLSHQHWNLNMVTKSLNLSRLVVSLCSFQSLKTACWMMIFGQPAQPKRIPPLGGWKPGTYGFAPNGVNPSIKIHGFFHSNATSL